MIYWFPLGLARSKAVTPPATPPPHAPSQHSLLMHRPKVGVKPLPVQLKWIVQQGGSTASCSSTSSKDVLASPARIAPGSLVPMTILPPPVVPPAAPRTATVAHVSTSVKGGTVSFPLKVVPSPHLKAQGVEASSPLTQPRATVVSSHSKSLLHTSAPSVPNITILSMPSVSQPVRIIGQSPRVKPVLVNRAEPKVAISILPTALTNTPSTSAIPNMTENRAFTKTQSVSSSSGIEKAESAFTPSSTYEGSLLQSMLQTNIPMNSHTSSTQLSVNLGLNTPSASASVTVSQPGVVEPQHSQSCSKLKPPAKKSANDHDYCFLKLSTKDLIKETVRVNKNQVKVEGPSLEEVKVVEENMEVNECEEMSTQAIEPQDTEEEVGALEPEPEGHSESEPNQYVFEEGEVMVDHFGNDKPLFEDTSRDATSPERVVTFGLGNGSPRRRKARRYRRQAEFSTSPIREDKGNFFDKIPSYYTALSIPVKPTKTTIYATASRSVGSMDHLSMAETSETQAEGHFDKVPSHRRCFTNTAKEVTLPTEVPEQAQDSDDSESFHSSRRRRRSSSHHSTSSHRSRYSYSRDSSYSSSPEPRHSTSRRNSRSPRTRSYSRSPRARSYSRGSSRSSSSCSTCSSSSYCSTCSGSSSSRSRSRSPSRERHRGGSAGTSASRSRSRSPREQRDRQMRGKRSRHTFSSRQSVHRSHSRSRSPRDYGREHSRKRSWRHRTRSRSSGDDFIAQRRKEREQEKICAMEERRVVYVGKIPDGYTKRQLHRRFECFGEIKEVKVNFREHGDNYGFVTFAYSCDAIAAKERGNSVPGDTKFDLCFGGRRRFCPDQYADLDGNCEIEEEYAPMPSRPPGELDYAALLKQHSNQQRK